MWAAPQMQNLTKPKLSSVGRHGMARCSLGMTIQPGGGPLLTEERRHGSGET